MTKYEDALVRGIAWIFSQACIWLLFAGAALLIIQCFYFAYYGMWTALPASLFFVGHEGLKTETGIRNPANFIPNVFDTGVWQSWIGIWNFIDFISIPALFMIISVLLWVLTVVFENIHIRYLTAQISQK